MHLSPEALVDLAEGTLAESDAPHLARCDACRRTLADVRAMLAAIAIDAMPEPSPLFWDHFSERVRAGVEADAATDGGDPAWASPRLRLLAAVAAFAAMLIVAATLRVGDRRPRPVPADAQVEIAASPSHDDPSLGLVAELTSDVAFDEAHDAGMMAHTGLVDRAIAGLSESERIELETILKEELAR